MFWRKRRPIGPAGVRLHIMNGIYVASGGCGMFVLASAFNDCHGSLYARVYVDRFPTDEASKIFYFNDKP